MPQIEKAAVAAAREVMLGASAVWTRDARSTANLREILGDRFDPSIHREGVDVAFLLPPVAPPDAETRLGWVGDEAPVGVNVSGLIWNQPDKARSQYGFEADYREFLHGLVAWLVEQGRVVLLVPHVNAPVEMYESDLRACRELHARLDDALRDQASRHLRLAALTEQLPDPESRVTLDATDRDIYGVPLPRLAYRVGDYARDAMAAAREAHAEIFGLLGATAVTHSPNFQGAGHIIGTARMGDDPATSVVDAELRSHQHRNLFLLGSAVFPTAGTANPTLTIAALTLRAAARVRDSLAG